ncbi:MAG: MCE family protein [Planctomycetota bacterium]|nr:MAG: MCE family protein [Planctomycetota bacterium]
MNDRVMQFRVGVMVLATAIIAGILIVLFGDLPSLVQRTYPLRMNFSDARGVTSGTPVRKNGILVGRVKDVALDEKGGVNVVADIDSAVPIYRDEEARITGSLLGDAEISLVPGIIQTPRQKLAENEVIQGGISRNPFEVFASLEPKLGSALESLVLASDSVSKLSANLDRLLLNGENEDRFRQLVQKTESALENFSLAMTNINAVVGNAAAREEILDTISALPEVIADLKSTVKGIGTTVDAADRNLRNLEGLTRPLGERGGEMVAQIDRTIGRLDGVLQQASQFTKALSESEGTIGKLVRDPKVYDELSEAVSNVNHLTRELRPIVDDVRVFTDKIARHPEQLGVRGALDRRPPGVK